jgi:hypothetical protein
VNISKKVLFSILNDFETLFYSEFDADSEYECLRSSFLGPKTCHNGTRPFMKHISLINEVIEI